MLPNDFKECHLLEVYGSSKMHQDQQNAIQGHPCMESLVSSRTNQGGKVRLYPLILIIHTKYDTLDMM